MTNPPTIASPCITVCKLDKHGICIGCFRSAKEIRDWYTVDDDQRKKILDSVKQRRLEK